MRPPRSPRISRWILRAAARGRDRAFVAADLESEFDRLTAAAGAQTARRWYRGQVRRSLGPLLAVRVTGGAIAMGTIGLDLRQAIRRLAASPIITLSVIATFGLGIGANAAMFSFVSSVLLRPLPFPEPDRLVRVFQSELRSPDDGAWVDPDVFRALERDNQSLAGVASFQTMADGFSLLAGDRAIQAYGARVSGGFFDVLGVKPLVGETCRPGDDRPGMPPKAMIGAAFWRSQFHADPTVAGRAVRLNGNSVTIAGVMPDGFWFPQGDFSSVWLCSPGPWSYQVVARLKPGVSSGEVAADFNRIVASVRQAGSDPWMLTARPLQRVLVGDLGPVLWLLVAAVTIVLAVACANITNLLLARAVGRRRELSVRAALGASRARLVRQMFVESSVLALAGTAAGVLMAVWLIPAIVSVVPRDLQTVRDANASIDWRVILWVAAAGLGSAVLWGTWPAMGAIGSSLTSAVNQVGRGAVSSDTPDRGRLRRLFVAAEFAMAVVLAVAACLVTRSLIKLQRVDAGVQPDHVITATIALPPGGYPTPASVVTFYDRLLGGVRALPGVSSVAISFGLPPDRVLNGATVRVPSRPLIEDQLHAEMVTVSNDYFRALGVPVVAGRVFDSRETLGSPPVTVISQTLATRLFGTANPVGRLMGVNGERTMVVGVVKDVKYTGLAGGGASTVYQPFVSSPMTYMALIVRTEIEMPSLVPAIRDQLAALDRDGAIGRVRTMDELLSESVGRPRFMTVLFVAFAVMALVLAAVGAYGVMFYAVSQKTREIGVRMALGARGRDIARLVAREGLGAALVGTVAGLLGAVALTRAMQSLLFGVPPTDLASFGAALGVLVVMAALACWIPARRAAKIDPVVALRDR